MPVYCKWFLLLFPLSIITEACGAIFRANGADSTFIYRIYQPVEFSLLSGFYYSLFEKSRFKRIAIAAPVVFVAFCAFYFIMNPGVFQNFHNHNDFAFEALLVSLLVVLYFIQILYDENESDDQSFIAFWLNANHLIFYGGCLCVMGAAYYLQKVDVIMAHNLMKIANVLNLVLYAGYTLIFLCFKTKKA